nr:hypothetical protein [uncultured Prevotella sp.]
MNKFTSEQVNEVLAKQITCKLVNLSTHQLVNSRYIVVLISADTDLIPPLEFIHNNYPDKKVKVFFPPGSHALELQNHLIAFHSKWVFLEKNERRFRDAVMPHTITVGDQSVSIPEKWK